jgi:hypothetical protein
VVAPVEPALDARRGWRATWATWLAIRFAGLMLLTGNLGYPQVDRDIFVYNDWARALLAGHLPWQSFNVEYPPGVLPFMAIPGDERVYELLFITLAVLADAAIMALLWRARPRGLGSGMWVLLPIALGPIIWVRFDICVAAALVGFVVALREQRWRTAGICLAAATLLKLWPLVLLVVAWRLIPRSGRRAVLGWTLGGIGALTVPVIGFGGGSGLLWMLRYQGGRGLEMETVWAWPVIVAHAFGAALRPVPGHGTTEVPISGVVSYAVSVVLPLAIVAVVAYVWRDTGRRLTVASACLLAVSVVLIASKVLSPQYVVWACALVAVVLDEVPARSKRERIRLAIATLFLAATTQLVFPFHFLALYLALASGVFSATIHAEAVVLWVVVVAHYVSTTPAAELLPSGGSAEFAVARAASVPTSSTAVL